MLARAPGRFQGAQCLCGGLGEIDGMPIEDDLPGERA
jgi:hypothetical protein